MEGSEAWRVRSVEACRSGQIASEYERAEDRNKAPGRTDDDALPPADEDSRDATAAAALSISSAERASVDFDRVRVRRMDVRSMAAGVRSERGEKG